MESLNEWAESITPDPEMVKASIEAAARGECLTTEEFLEEIRGKEKAARETAARVDCLITEKLLEEIRGKEKTKT